MGLTLYCSHRLEELGDALAAQLRSGPAQASGGLAAGADFEQAIFQPTTIVAPNQNIRKWLQLQIARQNCIAINLQFRFLEDELWQWLAMRSSAEFAESGLGRGAGASAPLQSNPLLQPIEKHTGPWLVLAALLGSQQRSGGGAGPAAVGAELLAPLTGYIERGGLPKSASESAGGVLSRQAAGKAWQLAERLAGLLRDYEFHRPDWIAYWRAEAGLAAGRAEADVAAGVSAKRSVMRPRDLPDTGLSRAEAELYRRLFLPGGLCEALGRSRGQRMLTLAQWALEQQYGAGAERLSPKRSAPGGGAVAGAAPLHIFSFPQVSAFHRQLLFAMAAERPVHLYLLNLGGISTQDLPDVSQTNWLPLSSARKVVSASNGERLVWPAALEGGPADAEERAVEGEAESSHGVESLVRGWGQAGAEGLYLIGREGAADQSHTHTVVHWLGQQGKTKKGVAQPPPNLLQGLQGWLLGESTLRGPEAPLPASTSKSAPVPDESLVLALCPSVQREVEVVYNCILWNLSTQPDLLQTDVLVLVPNMERYRPAIHAVFERGEAGLGYNLSDLSGAGDSLYAQGVTAALALTEGRFTRAEVFEFLRNPCVQAALGIDGKRLTQWVLWADALHVFGEEAAVEQAEPARVGLDQNCTEDRGLFGWRRALARLQLGRVMTAPSPKIGSDDAIPPDYAGMIPYADAQTGEAAELDGFIHTLELLADAVRRVRSAGSDGERWRREVHGWLTRFLAVPDEYPEEQGVQALVAGLFERLAATVREMSGAEVSGTSAGLAGERGRGLFGGPQVPTALVREALLAGLQEIPSRQGRYLSGGVTISTQFPLRPIPFRVIYMLGLDAGSFPPAAQRDVIDLRRDWRRLGDVDAGDLERFMFLEALLSARERLYLSAVNRDLQEDREVPLYSLLMQLRDFLARTFPHQPLPVVTVPLHGHAASYCQAQPTAAKTGFDWNYSRRDRNLAEQVLAREQHGAEGAGAGSVHVGPGQPAWGELVRQVPAVELGLDLKWEELATFLRSPLRAMLERRLGLRDDDEDAWEIEQEDTEPFFLSRTIRRAVERHMVTAYLAGRSRPEALAAAAAHLEMRHKLGETPGGAFQANERAQLLTDLGTEFWTREGHSIEALLKRVGDAVYRPLVIFGDSSRAREGAVRHGPLTLVRPADRETEHNAKAARTLRLHGAVESVWHSPDGTVVHLVAAVQREKGEAKGTPPPELFLPMLTVAALMAADSSQSTAADRRSGDAAPEPLFGFQEAHIHVLYRQALVQYRCRFDAAEARAAIWNLADELTFNSPFEFQPWDLLKGWYSDLRGSAQEGKTGALQADEFRSALQIELGNEDEDHPGVRISNLERISGVRLPADPLAVALRRFALLFKLEEVEETDGAAAESVTKTPAAVTATGAGKKRKDAGGPQKRGS